MKRGKEVYLNLSKEVRRKPTLFYSNKYAFPHSFPVLMVARTACIRHTNLWSDTVKYVDVELRVLVTVSVCVEATVNMRRQSGMISQTLLRAKRVL